MIEVHDVYSCVDVQLVSHDSQDLLEVAVGVVVGVAVVVAVLVVVVGGQLHLYIKEQNNHKLYVYKTNYNVPSFFSALCKGGGGGEAAAGVLGRGLGRR